MLKIESEKTLEAKMRKKIEKLGGLSFKLTALHFSGLPDRLCIFPGGALFFAEIKTTKKKPRKIQLLVHKKIRKLGFRVEVIETSQQIDNILKEYE